MEPKFKYKYPFELQEIPDFPTIREMIAFGHDHPKGGDNLQYIYKEKRVEKMQRMENFRIPENFDYGKIAGLSTESRQKLEKIRPITLGQASRISGIRQSDVMLLMVYLR